MSRNPTRASTPVPATPAGVARPPGARPAPAGKADTNLTALETLAFALVSLTSRAIAAETLPRQLTFQQWRALVVLGGTGPGVDLAGLVPGGSVNAAPEPRPMRVSDLGRRIGASGPSTSRIARRLVDHGLVEAAPDPRDRRAVGLRLTARGLDLRTRVVARRRELIRQTIGRDAPRPASAELTRLVEALAAEI